ncbi:MAG TPA: Dyp-type peroxidase [Chloroflexota bacterium]|nr:Dyp-type peroxidase [Chloroflexota bacterium]
MEVPREAPSPPPLGGRGDPSRPPVKDEPEIAADDIQGNILTGFNKDYQMLLFLKIVEGGEADFRQWLRAFTPRVSTAAQVIAFNRLFKAVRTRVGDPTPLKATWVNLAFSYDAIRRLKPDDANFTDEAFTGGMCRQDAPLGDPVGTGTEGDPTRWRVGGPHNPADLLLIVASDEMDDLYAMVNEIESTIYAPLDQQGQPVRSGLQMIFKQPGAVLPTPLASHEHFGFLDSVSQPGIRGYVNGDLTDVITLRQTPDKRDEQGKPGQDVLWPGEFVFGYPGQDPTADVKTRGPSTRAGPAWTENGSYLVFRRLRQDVHAFHAFLHDQANKFAIDPAYLGAKLVGRWPSGAPIMREPRLDNPLLGDVDCANNKFEFFEPTPNRLPTKDDGPYDCSDIIPGSNPPKPFPASPGDQPGVICPFTAHIRRAYPRDDTTPGHPEPDTAEADTQTHRLLRRGIPYGPPSRSTFANPVDDAVDRGLLFLAYQTSIVRQFEYVQQMANNPHFKAKDIGFDPIIGQNAGGVTRARRFTVTFVDGAGHTVREELTAPKDWVIPTGGGYFFAPGIHGLRVLAGE